MRQTALASSKNWIGTAWIVSSALAYGGMSISVKLSVPYLTVWQTAIGRFALGAILIPILAWPLRQSLFGQERWLLVVRGLLGTGSFLFLIQSFKTIPLSVAIVLFYLWPVFSCLLSPWAAGEPTTKREWPFVIGSLAGMVLVLWPDRSGSSVSIGHFMALGASFFAGFAITLIRRLGRTNNAFTIYFYFCLTGGLFCLGPLLTQNTPPLPASRTVWLVLMAVAVFAMAGQVLLNQGMKYLKASKASVLMMIEILAAASFGVIYLGEPIGLRLLCGSVLILGSGVALILLPMRPSPPGKESTPRGSGFV